MANNTLHAAHPHPPLPINIYMPNANSVWFLPPPPLAALPPLLIINYISLSGSLCIPALSRWAATVPQRGTVADSQWGMKKRGEEGERERESGSNKRPIRVPNKSRLGLQQAFSCLTFSYLLSVFVFLPLLLLLLCCCSSICCACVCVRVRVKFHFDWASILIVSFYCGGHLNDAAPAACHTRRVPETELERELELNPSPKSKSPPSCPAGLHGGQRCLRCQRSVGHARTSPRLASSHINRVNLSPKNPLKQQHFLE